MGVPLGANGPVRYTSSGMKISFACANTPVASGAATRATMSAPTSHLLTFMPVSPLSAERLMSPNDLSVRERPEPQLLLRDLPEPRESVRLDHEEENDQATEHHELDLLLQRHR